MVFGTFATVPLRCIALGAAVASACFGSPVSAAVVTFNIYQDSGSITCNNASVCDLVFGALNEEGNPDLFIDRISCNITTSPTALIRSVRSGATVGAVPPSFATGHFQGVIEELNPAPGFRVYNLNSETLTVVLDEESPVVRVNMAAPTPVIIIACHISGQLEGVL